MVKQIQEQLLESAQVKQRAAEFLSSHIEFLAKKAIECYRTGHKLILCGNGGSASDAEHIACELVGRFLLERPALPAIALSSNTSILSAIGNDYGYENAFARQIDAWAKPGDIVIGISTSGNSRNVVAALQRAKECGAYAVGLVGCDGGQVAAEADLAIIVPSNSTPRIQEAHITIGHILCDLIEQALNNPTG